MSPHCRGMSVADGARWSLHPYPTLSPPASWLPASGCLLAPATAQFFDERFPFDARRRQHFRTAARWRRVPASVPAAGPSAGRLFAARRRRKNMRRTKALISPPSSSWAIRWRTGSPTVSSRRLRILPRLTVVRKPRDIFEPDLQSGRHDVRNRNTDWPVAAQEILAKENRVLRGDDDRSRRPRTDPRTSSAAAQARHDAARKPAAPGKCRRQPKPADAKPADAKAAATSPAPQQPRRRLQRADNASAQPRRRDGARCDHRRSDDAGRSPSPEPAARQHLAHSNSSRRNGSSFIASASMKRSPR